MLTYAHTHIALVSFAFDASVPQSIWNISTVWFPRVCVFFFSYFHFWFVVASVVGISLYRLLLYRYLFRCISSMLGRPFPSILSPFLTRLLASSLLSLPPSNTFTLFLIFIFRRLIRLCSLRFALHKYIDGLPHISLCHYCYFILSFKWCLLLSCWFRKLCLVDRY